MKRDGRGRNGRDDGRRGESRAAQGKLLSVLREVEMSNVVLFHELENLPNFVKIEEFVFFLGHDFYS